MISLTEHSRAPSAEQKEAATSQSIFPEHFRLHLPDGRMRACVSELQTPAAAQLDDGCTTSVKAQPSWAHEDVEKEDEEERLGVLVSLTAGRFVARLPIWTHVVAA